mmetsp:Transcript_19309/g.44460  ORF Transcript_19309/g.44460 Transcript_19309/m.44460 type:complete len:273 (-) Transcript_19309:178-996(-)
MSELANTAALVTWPRPPAEGGGAMTYEVRLEGRSSADAKGLVVLQVAPGPSPADSHASTKTSSLTGTGALPVSMRSSSLSGAPPNMPHSTGRGAFSPSLGGGDFALLMKLQTSLTCAMRASEAPSFVHSEAEYAWMGPLSPSISARSTQRPSSSYPEAERGLRELAVMFHLESTAHPVMQGTPSPSLIVFLPSNANLRSSASAIACAWFLPPLPASAHTSCRQIMSALMPLRASTILSWRSSHSWWRHQTERVATRTLVSTRGESSLHRLPL